MGDLNSRGSSLEPEINLAAPQRTESEVKEGGKCKAWKFKEASLNRLHLLFHHSSLLDIHHQRPTWRISEINVSEKKNFFCQNKPQKFLSFLFFFFSERLRGPLSSSVVLYIPWLLFYSYRGKCRTAVGQHYCTLICINLMIIGKKNRFTLFLLRQSIPCKYCCCWTLLRCINMQ